MYYILLKKKSLVTNVISTYRLLSSHNKHMLLRYRKIVTRDTKTLLKKSENESRLGNINICIKFDCARDIEIKTDHKNHVNLCYQIVFFCTESDKGEGLQQQTHIKGNTMELHRYRPGGQDAHLNACQKHKLHSLRGSW